MTHKEVPSSFWKDLSKAEDRLLILDYDGTLAPFRVERDQAVPYPGVRELLDGILADGGCRVVIVSGRWTQDLLPLLGLKGRPEIWGCHGWERLLSGGEYRLGEIPPPAQRALEEGMLWAQRRGLESLCERKPVSLALHWRGLPHDRVDLLKEEVSQGWGVLATRGGIQLHPFDGGVELRVPGRDKGSAVRTILAETKVDATVAYLGDDLTDEDAFESMVGKGLGILVRSEHRPTAASVWLRPPEDLIEFLESWRRSCHQEGEE